MTADTAVIIICAFAAGVLVRDVAQDYMPKPTPRPVAAVAAHESMTHPCGTWIRQTGGGTAFFSCTKAGQ